MSVMTAQPRTIKRVAPGGFNHSAMERMPPREYDEQTDMWEAEQDRVVAVAPTQERAEDFVRFILARRATQGESE